MKNIPNPSIVYPYKENLYLNITNRCPVKCSYCIKYRWKGLFRKHNLKLSSEPSLKKIISELKRYKFKNYKEIVFCGYGEPLLRLDVVKKVAKFIKQNSPETKVRVNTSGLVNIFSQNENFLDGLVDSISVSLNAHNSKTYIKLHKTAVKEPYKKILEFIKNSKKHFPEVSITAVHHPEIDISKIKSIAETLGVNFRLRKYLEEYEPE